MVIQQLPETTVRTLGACQAINDAASVVKELLDNALDARATSIAVEISANTVGSVQARDNGRGIPPSDRALVARPHCTSKVSSEDDLKHVGGLWLGFRGEALASIAGLSGSLTVSTRVEGEQVAVALQVNQQGEIFNEERASLPIGTTVKVTDFLNIHPVRRQVALKDTDRCLKKVKLLMQSYAFARPHVRLSLRVLKAKNNRANWMYAPKPGGNAEDAALKIVGVPCVAHCAWSVIEERDFTIKACLPRVDADVSKISNAGAFLSIDARPVSAARGTTKEILKMFREALKNSTTNFDGVKEPFIYLDIVCPSGSYDVNIEPAKDDVLFENPEVVIGAVKVLFDAVYPNHQATSHMNDSTVPPSPQLQPRAATHDDEFITSLELPFNKASQPIHIQMQHPRPDREDDATGLLHYLENQAQLRNESPDVRPNFRPTMYGCDEEDLEMLDARPPTGRTEADREEFREARKDINLSNPWMLAKLNASVRRPTTIEQEVDSELEERTQLNALTTSSEPDRRTINLEARTLPTPRPSSPIQSCRDAQPTDYLPDFAPLGDGRSIGPQMLAPPQALVPPSSARDGTENHLPPNARGSAYNYSLTSQSSTNPSGTPYSAIPDISTKPRRSAQKQSRQSQINRPFVPPRTEQLPREKVWFDHLEEEEQRRSRPAKKRSQPLRASHGLVMQGELGDITEDPRPLTPPKRNTDIRNFVTSIDMTADDSAASLIESRNFSLRKRARSSGDETHTFNECGNENKAPANGIPSGRVFISSSEVTAVETQMTYPSTDEIRQTKRRKDDGLSALREKSHNVGPGGHDHLQPTIGKRPKSRRRTTDGARARRTKSSLLPLERVPAGDSTKGVLLDLTLTMLTVSVLINKFHVLGNWPSSVESVFGVCGLEEIHNITTKLHSHLARCYPNDKMAQDLSILVKIAFADQTRASVESDHA